ncbi:hypothetical protein AALO_G00299900 [Alosa alosa]|uniref:Uncharacterized protein n=1 Tax=Alosa alosa TaxID=278164 RepID=A0AAV6FEL0_9TELE|nr:hypothetical protein AALO_G00299900 [Alosa alosa]
MATKSTPRPWPTRCFWPPRAWSCKPPSRSTRRTPWRRRSTPPRRRATQPWAPLTTTRSWRPRGRTTWHRASRCSPSSTLPPPPGAKAERDRSPLRRSAPLLPDPVMKPFMYQRAKRRALLPTPAGREEAAQEEDAMARYYSEYYQQLQQYPQYQYAYPPPGALAMQGLTTLPAPSCQPCTAALSAAGALCCRRLTAASMATTLDALRPVPLPPPPPAPPAPVSAPPPPVVASAAAVAMATPHHQLHHHHHRLYEPPPPSLPPPAPQARKDALLRPLHTPDAPYR